MQDKLITIALTAQILAPTSHPSLVGNLCLTGSQEQECVRQGFAVNDELEENVQWMMESREAQRNLLEKWLAPIVARFMQVFLSAPRF